MKQITVQVHPTYGVLVGEGLLDRLGELSAGVSAGRRAAVITDDTVDGLYGGRAVRSLEGAGFSACKYVFPHGEGSKNLAVWGSILAFLAENRLTRSDLVVALGGGVTGDMAGFAAACYLRGISFVQVPTTLLAAIDSSVGGKTAVDLPQGKNLAGAFHQPALVLCDPLTLDTLPPDTLADGMAEAVKTGIIGDKALFELLSRESLSPEDRTEIILRCVELKRALVERDERDHGDRQLLNLGHTMGHGVEKLSGYRISHGQAVAMGTAAMARTAWRAGLSREDNAPAIIRALERRGLPTACPYGAGELAAAALSDKKRSGGRITVVIPERIGHSTLHTMAVEELEGLFALGLE